MHTLSAVWGVLATIGCFIGFIPCLGALNWLVIPFALIGLIISGIATSNSNETTRGSAITGLVLCGFATIFGIIRLIFGGGIL